MSIIFVTAYKDIGRSSWKSFSRSTQEYLQLFINLALHIDYNLVVFVEDHIYDLLLRELKRSNVKIFNSKNINTFMDKYLETERSIISSSEYQKLIPSHRKLNPEHLFAEYNLVNHDKINYIYECKKLYPDYEYYSWIDFGCIRRLDNLPKDINFSNLSKKITYLSLLRPQGRIDPRKMLSIDDIYIAGSQFVVQTELVNKFQNLYDDKLKELHKIGVSDDDQNVVYQIYTENSDLFDLKEGKDWFSLFRLHLNTR